MLGEHYQGIQSLTAKLGGEHLMAMELHQGHDRLVNDANKALRLSKSVVMSLDDLDTEDWANTIPTAAMSETDTAGEEDPAEIDATKAADVSIGKQSAASRSPGQTPSTPATTQRLMRIVNNLHSEITEVIETIYDNIDYRRADILVCLPELGRALSGLMEDHTQHIRHVRDLASKLDDHGLVKEVEEGQVQLEDEVNEAFRLVEMFSMGEDWVEGQDAGDTTAYSYDGPVLAATAAVTVTASCNPATQAGCETDTPASQDRTETPAPRAGTYTPASQTQARTSANLVGPALHTSDQQGEGLQLRASPDLLQVTENILEFSDAAKYSPSGSTEAVSHRGQGEEPLSSNQTQEHPISSIGPGEMLQHGPSTGTVATLEATADVTTIMAYTVGNPHAPTVGNPHAPTISFHEAMEVPHCQASDHSAREAATFSAHSNHEATVVASVHSACKSTMLPDPNVGTSQTDVASNPADKATTSAVSNQPQHAKLVALLLITFLTTTLILCLYFATQSWQYNSQPAETVQAYQVLHKQTEDVCKATHLCHHLGGECGLEPCQLRTNLKGPIPARWRESEESEFLPSSPARQRLHLQNQVWQTLLLTENQVWIAFLCPTLKLYRN